MHVKVARSSLFAAAILTVAQAIAGSVAEVGALPSTLCSATNPGATARGKPGGARVTVVDGWASTAETRRLLRQYRSRVLFGPDSNLALAPEPDPGLGLGSGDNGVAVPVIPVAARPALSTDSLCLDRPGDAADPFLAGLVARVALTVGVQARRCEPVVITRYLPPQRYGIHHDAGYVNRSHTFLLYLTDLASGAGGQTIFPRAAGGDAGNANSDGDDDDDDGEGGGYPDDRRPTQGLEQLCAEQGAEGIRTIAVTPVAGKDQDLVPGDLVPGDLVSWSVNPRSLTITRARCVGAFVRTTALHSFPRRKGGVVAELAARRYPEPCRRPRLVPGQHRREVDLAGLDQCGRRRANGILVTWHTKQSTNPRLA